MGMTISMAFQYGRTVDLTTLTQVGLHWQNNLTCDIEMHNGRRPTHPYVNRTALEHVGAEDVSFRYADKTEQAILTFKKQKWYLNGEYLCDFEIRTPK